jgi:hypothetical protein
MTWIDDREGMGSSIRKAVEVVALAEIGRLAVSAWVSRPRIQETVAEVESSAAAFDDEASVVVGARRRRLGHAADDAMNRSGRFTPAEVLNLFNEMGDMMIAEPRMRIMVDQRMFAVLWAESMPHVDDFATCDLDALESVIQMAITELPPALHEFDVVSWGSEHFPRDQSSTAANAAGLLFNYLTREAGRETRGPDWMPYGDGDSLM